MLQWKTSLAVRCRCLCIPTTVTKVKETQAAAQGMGTDNPNAKYVLVSAGGKGTCSASLSQPGAGLAYSSFQISDLLLAFVLCFAEHQAVETRQTHPGTAAACGAHGSACGAV